MVFWNRIMTFEIKIVILILATTGLAIVTRRSLTSFRSHGLYRLFTWAASLALVLLNLDHWFEEAFAIRQVVSWLLLLLSIVTVAYGSISLRQGRPDNSRNDSSLMGIERTTKLVMNGAYRYIRHPIYGSFLIGAVGVLLKHVSVASALLAGIISVLAVVTAKVEEAENIRYFGSAYRDYMKHTRMFIPYLL